VQYIRKKTNRTVTATWSSRHLATTIVALYRMTPKSVRLYV